METRYECLVIYNSVESIFEESKKKLESLLKEQHLKIEHEQDMGSRALMHRIKNNTHGHYYSYILTSENTQVISKVSKELGLREDLLRYIFVHLDKDAAEYLERRKAGKSSHNTEVSDAEAEKRREARLEATSQTTDRTERTEFSSPSSASPSSTQDTQTTASETGSSKT